MRARAWSAATVNQQAVLAAFDEQVRRHPETDGAAVRVERAEGIVRVVSAGDEWTGVAWSDLDQRNVDAAIAAQIGRFAGLARAWEWKHYSYDRPVDLTARLQAAGLTPEPSEALLIAEIAELQLGMIPPAGVTLLPVDDERGIETLVQVHDDVFGGDHSGLGRAMAARLAQRPVAVAAVVAVAGAGGIPISAGRVEFHIGTEFASLWGGGTLPAWRRRGVFRALVAHRAALAADAGFRYLQVDASVESRPILRRLGFVQLATTTPFVHPGRGDGCPSCRPGGAR